MTPAGKRAVWLIVLVALLAASFVFGRWSGSLRASLKSEASYPWDLHRKIGNVPLRCDELIGHPTMGRFFIASLDGGETLIVASYDRDRATVTAHAIGPAGTVATDTWPLECR